MEVVLFALGIVFCAAIVIGSYKMLFKERRQEPLEIDHAELEAAERALKEAGETDWVVLKRCHGPAYNHGAMSAIIAALSADNIQATYDVMSTSSADGGVTNFMLKVLRGSEAKAMAVLTRLDEEK